MLGRTFVSFGFVGIAVTGPRLVAAAARERHHGLALGLWSIYMPAGMALAMFLAPLLIPALGWRGFWLVSAGSVIVFIPVAFGPSNQMELTNSRNQSALSDGAPKPPNESSVFRSGLSAEDLGLSPEELREFDEESRRPSKK